MDRGRLCGHGSVGAVAASGPLALDSPQPCLQLVALWRAEKTVGARSDPRPDAGDAAAFARGWHIAAVAYPHRTERLRPAQPRAGRAGAGLRRTDHRAAAAVRLWSASHPAGDPGAAAVHRAQRAVRTRALAIQRTVRRASPARLHPDLVRP